MGSEQQHRIADLKLSNNKYDLNKGTNRTFEREDRDRTLKDLATLFIGSSIVAIWNLNWQELSRMHTVGRGFGEIK